MTEEEYDATDEEIVISDEKSLLIKELKKIPGVGDALALKLLEGGCTSAMDVAATPPGVLSDKTGKSKAACEKLITQARSICSMGSLISAPDLYEKQKVEENLTSGSKEVDALLGGGYHVGLVTEIHGVNGNGKTQACLTATVMATRPVEEGGLDTDVVYLDTENTLKVSRLAQIAQTRGFDVEETLARIHVIKVHTASHQVVAMDEVRKFVQETDCRLIVVDSIIAHFRAEYTGRGVLAERQQLLNKHIADLKQFAESHNAVVLVTNQMSASPDAMFGPGLVPVGGNVIGHACAYRLYIRAGKQGKRIMRLVKSPDMPSGECISLVSEKGLCDA